MQQDDVQAVTHICRMVEAMPLGIMLAAAWERGQGLELEGVVAELLAGG